MARNEIESDFQTSKMATGSHFVKKIKNNTKSVSKMARNVIQSEFRTFKMADSNHFVKQFFKKFRIDLKWPEMRPKVIFGHPKWPSAAIL